METEVALSGVVPGAGGETHAPANQEEEMALRALEALARRLPPEIKVEVACSRAPDGVVNVLPTVVDIPAVGRFHEFDKSGWVSQEGKCLPGWYADLLTAMNCDIRALKQQVLSSHILQGSSKRGFTSPMFKLRLAGGAGTAPL